MGWRKLLWSGFEFHAIIAWCNYRVVLRCKSLKYIKVKNGKDKKFFDSRTEIKNYFLIFNITLIHYYMMSYCTISESQKYDFATHYFKITMIVLTSSLFLSIYKTVRCKWWQKNCKNLGPPISHYQANDYYFFDWVPNDYWIVNEQKNALCFWVSTKPQNLDPKSIHHY